MKLNYLIMSLILIISILVILEGRSEVTLCDPRTGSSAQQLLGHESACRSLHWSPLNEYQLVTGGNDTTIRFWDIRKPRPMVALDMARTALTKNRHQQHVNRARNAPAAHSGSVEDLQYTPDGRHLVSFGTDAAVMLWNLADFTNCMVNYSLGIHRNRSLRKSSLDINPDGTLMALTLGNCVGLIDIFDGQNRVVRFNYQFVECCKFHPSYEELYTGDQLGQIVAHVPRDETLPKPSFTPQPSTVVGFLIFDQVVAIVLITIS